MSGSEVVRTHEGHHSEQETGFRHRTRRGTGYGDPKRDRQHRVRLRTEPDGQEEDDRGQDEALPGFDRISEWLQDHSLEA